MEVKIDGEEMSKETSHIGQIIKNARRASGLSQMQLAEKLGLSYQQVQKYEKGASEITVKRLYQFAEALEIPVHAFLTANNLTVAESPSLYGKVSDEEDALLTYFRKIGNRKIRDMIITSIKAISEKEKRK